MNRSIVVFEDDEKFKIADLAASVAKGLASNSVNINKVSTNLSEYQLMVLGFGSKNFSLTREMSDFLHKLYPPRRVAVFTVSETPIIGYIKSHFLMNIVEHRLRNYMCKTVGRLFIEHNQECNIFYKNRSHISNFKKADNFGQGLRLMIDMGKI